VQRLQARPGTALRWFAAGAVLLFGVTFVGSGLLELQHDLYYLIYFTIAAGFMVAFTTSTRTDWRGQLRPRLGWSVAIGAALAVVGVRRVLGDASTPHPDGAYFVFELLWRGVVYGAVDSMVLFLFPAAIARMILDRGPEREHGLDRLRFGALFLLLSLVMTSAYHLGYPQYRSSEYRLPVIGSAFAAVPAAVTGNALGGLVWHVPFHVTGTVHAYETGSYIPPALEGYDELGSGAAGRVAAGAWIAATGIVVLAIRWRRGRSAGPMTMRRHGPRFA
jgi:hypothetical protein